MKTVWTNTAARVITIFTVDQDKDMMYCTFIMAAITYLNFAYLKRQPTRGQTPFSARFPALAVTSWILQSADSVQLVFTARLIAQLLVGTLSPISAHVCEVEYSGSKQQNTRVCAVTTVWTNTDCQRM